jgi:hypothetical protein
MCTKILGLRSLLPHLPIFCPRALSHSFVTLEIIMSPPPPAVLDPSPGACCHLIADPRVHHHLDHSLRARRRRPLPQAICAPLLVIVAPPPSTSTPPPLEHAIIVDLDPASLRVCHHCPLPEAQDTASGKGDTPPLPHYRSRLVRFERYLLPM